MVNLQYTLLLLIPVTTCAKLSFFPDLQYTLLLLIPITVMAVIMTHTIFTIHFATINTVKNDKVALSIFDIYNTLCYY